MSWMEVELRYVDRSGGWRGWGGGVHSAVLELSFHISLAHERALKSDQRNMF